MNYIILIALIIIGLDQATKYLAKQYLLESGVMQIVLLGDWLKLTYVENPGIAFGVELPGGRLTISIFSIVAVSGICWFIFKFYRNNWPYKISFSLVIGGAIGNLIDRVWVGRVIDFAHFDLYNGTIGSVYLSLWPVFNVADAAISIGVVLSMIYYQHIFEPLQEPIDPSHNSSSLEARPSSITESPTDVIPDSDSKLDH